MKEEINLLPPVAKESRLHRLYGSRWSSLYWAVISSCLLIALVYAGIIYTYWASAQDLKHEIAGLTEIDQLIGKEIGDVNRLLELVERQARNNTPWTDYLEDIMQSAPANVSLTAIRLRTDTADPAKSKTVLVVSGTTPSRPAIVDYERKLKTLPWVEELEAPLTNLASGPDVAFTFTITRKDKEISAL